MNKICKTLLICLMAILACACFVACGDTKTGSEAQSVYKIYGEDGYYTLVSYVGSEETVTIPEKIGETPVGRIKKDAFAGNGNIKKLIIPTSVEVIDQGAFSKMKALEELTIPFVGNTPVAEATLNSNNVTAVNKSVDDKRTFGYMFSLSSYDGGVKISQYYNDSTSTDSEGNTTDTGVFECYLPEKLSTVTVNPKSSEYVIPAYAFANNKLISKVVLTENVKEIGEYAFADCVRINTLKIPASVTDIYSYAFRGTLSLGDYKESTGKGLSFSENAQLKNIGDYAFVGCKLTNLTLPDSVENIGKFAFASMQESLSVLANGETKIKTVTLSENLKTIGDYAFFMCSNLEEVKFNANSANVTVGVSAFAYCDNLSKFDSTDANTINLTKVSVLKATAFSFIEKQLNVQTGSLSSDVISIAFLETDFVTGK